MGVPGSIRAVLFDAAGTLIETREPVGETYARAARAHGVNVPAWQLDDAFARIFRRAPPRVFPDARPQDTPDLERAWWRSLVRSTFRAADSSVAFRDFEAFFDALFRVFSGPEVWRCRTGAHEALRALRARGIAVGVVSNFDRRLPELLEALGLAPFVDAVVLASDAGVEKPDPRIFALALERLGVAAANSVFVGDSQERDLAGAAAAGLRAIDVASLATLCDVSDLCDPPELIAQVGPPGSDHPDRIARNGWVPSTTGVRSRDE